MIAYNISWDIDIEEYEEEEVEDILFALPDEVSIPKDIKPEDVADYLSDEYGFCVSEFQLK